MSDASDESDITLTIIRTSDAKRMEIVLPISTKLGELKEDLGTDELFGPISPDHQRLFFLGRELKSKNRSLQKLGLDRYPKNRVLHLHVKKPTATTTTSKRQSAPRRTNNNTSRRQTRSSQQKVTVTQTSGGDVLEIHDDSDDEIIIEENPRDKRRRIS